MSTQVSTVALSVLKKRVLERADMVESEFIDDTSGDSELVRFIQQSYRKLYRLIVTTYKDYFFGDPTSFTIAQGVNTFTVATDFYKLSGVDIDVGGGSWIEVPLFNFNERNRRVTTAITGRTTRVRYRLVGNQIRFTPTDEASGSYRYWYTPKPNVPVDDTDTIEGYNGWDEFVVIDAAIKCKDKEESDVSVLILERNELAKDILEDVTIRDDGATDSVQDVNFEDYYEDRLF